MKNINHENEYETRDFYLSCVVLSTGTPIKELYKSSAGHIVFVFAIKTEDAEKLLNLHWNGELTISSKDLIESIYQLKRRMRGRIS